MKSFDLIVIGAGSGLDVAVEAANRGWKVALIEEGPLGGTCLNRGCIPSKMVIHAADVAETAGKFGLTGKINFSATIGWASKIVDKDARAIEQGLRSEHNPRLLKAHCRFVGNKILEVAGERIMGKKILIAAGARPIIPTEVKDVPHITSKEALRLKRLPKSMIIVGGGYIAAEMGHFYGTMGCKITIIQRGPLLIPREDKEVSAAFTARWKKKYQVLLNSTVAKAEKRGAKVAVYVGKKKYTAEKLLVVTGVQPNSDLLDVDKTGVIVNEKGFILVNEYMQTSNKDIFALGDIVGKYLFKHSANLEAEYVLANLFGAKKKVDYYPLPHAIFTSPQIAGVGLTEQECQGKKYVVGRYEYRNTGMGLALREEGFVKFIVERDTKEILGCHILGPQASILIHEVVAVMKADRFKALDILRNAVHVHPALSEVVQRAAGSVKV